MPIFEKTHPEISSLISYSLLLNHLEPLTESDLLTWKKMKRTEHNLDTLYELMCHDEMKGINVFLETVDENVLES